MSASLITSLSLIFSGLLGAGLALPLLFDRVPRNSLYGFRTKLTLSSDEIWYPANRYAAKTLIAWGLITTLIGLLSLCFQPLSSTLQFLLIAPLIGIIIPVLLSLRWLRLHHKPPNAINALETTKSEN